MFYSHQLLSKKGPLGQIWIAATIQGKMNKKKVERIDITEICTHIIEPQVPLALRLSGILMGGVVIVYSRKVNILLDDANEFLTKLKTVVAAKPVDNITLPKNRQNAKYDAITIQFDPAAFGDIERLLLHPNGTQTQDPMREDFFVMPRVEVENATSTRRRDKHQAQNEDITLEERLPMEAEGIREMEDDILPPPDPMEMDFLALPGADIPDLPDIPDMPDMPFRDDIPFPAGGLDTIMEETKQEGEEEALPTPPDLKTPPKAKRANRGRKRQVILIDDITEIPALEFDRWLKDSSELVGRPKRRCVRTELATINKLFRLPGTLLSRNMHGEPITGWSSELLEIFEERINKRDAVKLEKSTRKKGTSGLKEDGEKLEEEAQPAQGNATHDNFFEGGDFVDFPAPDIQDMDFPLPDNEEFGSVEKLRAALKTPGSNPDDAFGDFTPIPTGLPVDGSARSKMSKQSASSRSGRLAMDEEADAPTTGKSRRAQRLSEVLSQAGVSPGINGPLGGDLLPTFDDETPGQDRLREALSMHNSLMEETAPTQARYVHDAIDRVTSNVMNYMREQLDAEDTEEPHMSMDEMTRGLDRAQAAKFFYQVCVMASNRFIKVEQEEPYGDIIMLRSRLL